MFFRCFPLFLRIDCGRTISSFQIRPSSSLDLISTRHYMHILGYGQ
jgi:hypothetical protein